MNGIQVDAADYGQFTLANAWHRYDHPDVFAAALEEDPNARTRYDVYVALAEIAPDSVVLIPDHGEARTSRSVSRLYSFGAVDEVVETRVDARGLGELALSQGVLVASGAGGSHGAPWVILVDGENGRDRGGPLLDLHGVLTGTAATPVLPEPREWWWLVAMVQHPDSDYYYTNVLVESSVVGLEGDQVLP